MSASDEVRARVEAGRSLLVMKGNGANKVEIVRWRAESSGRLTTWHIWDGTWVKPNGEPWTDAELREAQREWGGGVRSRGRTMCGLTYPLSAARVAVIDAEFEIPAETLRGTCGACLLMSEGNARGGSVRGRA